MCELGVFPIFVESDLSKDNKILGLMFFSQEKDFQWLTVFFGKTTFSVHLTAPGFHMGCLIGLVVIIFLCRLIGGTPVVVT